MTRFMGNINFLCSLLPPRSAIMAQAGPNLLFFDSTMGYRAHASRLANQRCHQRSFHRAAVQIGMIVGADVAGFGRCGATIRRQGRAFSVGVFFNNLLVYYWVLNFFFWAEG